MNINEFITKKRILFVVLFALIVLIGYQLNFSSVLGIQNQSFTFFQFFGPISGSFLGPFIGGIAVIIAAVGNFIMSGQVTAFSVARIFTMFFAAYYFGSKWIKKDKLDKSNWIILVPLVCMFLYMIHPIGNQTWFYSLYWIIPIVAKLLPERLILRSLGATFTAHAVGSVAYLYLIPSTPALWVMLIPIVAFERGIFTLGIAGTYLVFNTVLSKLENIVPFEIVNVDPRYILSKQTLQAQPAPAKE